MNQQQRQRGNGFAGQRALRPEDLLQLLREPPLRWHEVQGGDSLLRQTLLHPNDPYLADVLALTVERQRARALVADDCFWGNYPPAGVLPSLAVGRIPLCSMPIRDVLSIGVSDICKNVLLVGPTGSGKTNWLRIALLALLQSGDCTVVAFDRKGDLAECASLAAGNLPLLVLDWRELKLAFLQPVDGLTLNHWINLFVQLLATHLSLIASRRLMLDTLQLLYQRHRPPGKWPTIAEWIELLEKIRADSISRLGQYREAAMFALRGIATEFGDVIQFSSSGFFDRLYSARGVFIIRTSGLSTDVASLLASLFINWLYERRGIPGVEADGPVIFVLDDALPLVRGSIGGESEGGINPLSTWAFMSRARQMGFIVAAQNFSLISPALRNNADSILCFGSYGRDAEELARHLSLSADQAARLPVIRPGEVVAIARSVWPLAVYGRVPEVK